jgi:hypothetical protein
MLDSEDEAGRTYTLVSGLFIFVALLVGLGLVLIRLSLLVGELLPLFSEDFANIAWTGQKTGMETRQALTYRT